MLWLKFTVTGKQCHGSTPEQGKNTLLASSKLIIRLQDLYTKFDQKDDLFAPPISTFEPTKKEANVPNINTIPGKDVFYLDCRILPNYTLQDVLGSIEEIIALASKELDVKIEYEIVHKADPSSTSPKEPLIHKLVQAIDSVYGTRAQSKGVGGGTVASYLRKKNFPAVVWATLQGNAHQPNEFTSIECILNDAKVMSSLLLQDN